MPQSTDLVTDLPADFETFGQAVATSMADLLGGTTGQVLSKASNTDMDFTWVTSDDANAIQNAIVDAKGDLIAATAADTPARLAVGANGTVLTADSSTATGLKWETPSAGSNTFVGCYLQKSANQSINNTTLTTVTWDVETLDSDGFHSNVTNNGRITIPAGKAGKYSVGVSLNWASNSTGLRQILFAKNGTTFSWSQTGAATTGATMVNKNIIVDLAVGDYVEIQAYQTSGGALNLQTNAVDTDLTNYYAYYLGA